jgi:hypothetical protein
MAVRTAARIFGHAQNSNGPRPMPKTPNKPALFQSSNHAVHAGLALQSNGGHHFLEVRGLAVVAANVVIDELEKIELRFCQHRRHPRLEVVFRSRRGASRSLGIAAFLLGERIALLVFLRAQGN